MLEPRLLQPDGIFQTWIELNYCEKYLRSKNWAANIRIKGLENQSLRQNLTSFEDIECQYSVRNFSKRILKKGNVYEKRET